MNSLPTETLSVAVVYLNSRRLLSKGKDCFFLFFLPMLIMPKRNWARERRGCMTRATVGKEYRTTEVANDYEESAHSVRSSVHTKTRLEVKASNARTPTESRMRRKG